MRYYDLHIGIGVGTTRMDISEFFIGKTTLIGARNTELAFQKFTVTEAATARSAFCGNFQSCSFHCGEYGFFGVRFYHGALVLDMHFYFVFGVFDVS